MTTPLPPRAFNALGLIATVAGLVLSAGPASSEVTPLGPEVLVGFAGTGACGPQLAGHDDGSFAIAWAGARGAGIKVVAADPAGEPGPECRLEARSGQLEHLIATAEGYTIVWQGAGPRHVAAELGFVAGREKAT